jgi:type 1 glutamine amidotransferase
MFALLTGLAFLASAAAVQPVPAHPASVRDPRNWPVPVMDRVAPALPSFHRGPAVLVFSKTNGFRDDASIQAANAAVEGLARARGWNVLVSENAALFNPRQIARFDLVVFNSTSGDIFTPDQRAAFRAWLERGGGFVALHGAGGDPHYDWDWYVDVVLGAQFIGHTGRPKQFQLGTIRVVDRNHPAMRPLPPQWRREEEWYAFNHAPSGYRTRVLARLDESSYEPPANQAMGDHPIVWTRCIGRGRVFFSALGHKAETYSEPLHLAMIGGALQWAVEARRKGCR